MLRRLAKSEAGYSLVEVIVSILILTAVIIPMVSMFDVGLRTTNSGGNYDTARATANAAMENVKVLPYNKVSTPAADSVVERFGPGADRACPVAVPAGFTCTVRTRFANSSLTAFQDAPQTTQMEVVVRVSRDGSSTVIRTTGLVSGSRS